MDSLLMPEDARTAKAWQAGEMDTPEPTAAPIAPTRLTVLARLRSTWSVSNAAFNQAGRRTKIGVTVSVLYLSVLTVLILSRHEEFMALQLNALGDFLAGSFAPLAFMWLVLGYSQQGDELRQNGEALLLQAKELHHSVEEQRALVSVARDEHAANIEAMRLQREQWEAQKRDAEAARQPLFQFHPGIQQSSNGRRKMHLTVTNLGGDCSNVSVGAPTDPEVSLRIQTGAGAFLKNSSREGSLEHPLTRPITTSAWIRYQLSDGATYGTEYVIEVGTDFLAIKPASASKT